MALNTFKCNYLTPLHFKGLRLQVLMALLIIFDFVIDLLSSRVV